MLLTEFTDRALLDYSSLRAMISAPLRNNNNLQDWIHNNPDAIMKEEPDFVNYCDVSLAVSQPKSPLRRLFGDGSVYPTQKYLGLFRKTPLHAMRSGEDGISLISDDSVNLFASMAVFLQIGNTPRDCAYLTRLMNVVHVERQRLVPGSSTLR